MNKNIIEKSIGLKDLYKEIGYTKEDKERIKSLVSLYDIMNDVREEKIKSNLTQDEISKRSGIPRSGVSKILQGKSNVSVERLARLAIAFNKTLTIKFS